MSESYSITAVLKANVDNFVSGMKQARSQMDNFVKNNKQTFDSFKQVGTMATVAGTAIAVGLGATVKLASDYQTAFAGVRKTTDATEAEFDKLSQGIRNMSKELPASAVEIANVAEVAGQLGIKKDDILKFTRTMVDLGVSTNMSSEEAATSLARLANITQMPMENIDRLGSTVVALGNNLATTEGEIVAMSLRLAGVGAQIGLSEADIAGLAAAMSSVGIEAEAGGSAMSMVMKKIDKAVSLGGAAVEDFSEVTGLSANEFAALWKAKPIEALDLFIKSLGDSADKGENLAAMLDFMGIKGIREQDAILRLAGAHDVLGDSVDIANTAWDENTALTKEAEERYKTLESKMSIFMNVLKDIGISIGNVLMPYVTMLIDKLTDLGKWVGDLNPKFVTIATIVATVAAGFLLLVGPLLLLIGFIPMIISGFAALTTVFATIGAAIGAVISPITIAIAAIALIGAALVLAYNKVGWFRDSINSIWESIKSVTVAAFEVVKTAVLLAMDAVVNFAREKLATLLAFWQENGAQISAAAQNVWNGILAVVNFVMPAIQAVIQAVWFVIQTVVMSVWENIKGVIDGALNIIMGLVKTFASLFTGDWQGMWDGIKQMFSGVIEFLWNAVQLMLWGKLLKGVAVFAGSFKTAVTTMWTAIRGSFTTAINAIKSFFTAGFNAMKSSGTNIMNSIKSVISTVWNAIKTVFTNTINAIKNFFVNGFNSMKSSATSIMGAIRSVISTVWNAIKAVISSVINAVKSVVTSGFNLIRSTISNVMNSVRSLISSVWNGIKSTISNVINSIKSVVSSGFSGVANAIRSKMAEAVSAVASKMVEMLGKVTGAASKFLSAGKDLIRGLINGITQMGTQAITAITGVVDGVVNKAKSLLGIKSPSRVFMEIGGFLVQGMEKGMSARKKHLEAVMKDLTLMVKDITNHYKSEEVKITRTANAEISKIEKRAKEDVAKIYRTLGKKKKQLTKDDNVRIARIRQDAANKVASIEKKATKDSVSLLDKEQKDKLKEIKLFIEDKKSLNKLTLVEEAALWKKTINMFSEGSKERVEAQKNYNDAISAINKDQLERIKTYISDKKSVEELSLVDEARIWEEAVTLFKEGSKERIEAQFAHKKAVEAVNKEITAINQEYSDKMQKINDDLAKSEHDLNAEYEKAYADRVRALTSFAGLFDEFSSKFEGSGQDLIGNLAGQVDALSEWSSLIGDLGGRIKNEDLMGELRDLGPKAVGELKALTSLSDAELSTYVALYETKSKLARQQADKELAGMKADTTLRISELRAAANKELDILQKEWTQKITSITKATDAELKTLKQVGVNAGKGLMDGLASMQGPLIAKATEIANAIKAAMQSALDIHSPSRWMRDMIGKNMMLGWIDGMQAMKSKVIAMSVESTDWMKPDVGGLSVPSFNGVNVGNHGKTNNLAGTINVKGGGGIVQHIAIHSPKPTSPSDNARLIKQQSRQLATEWGV